ncbi:MAG: sensor histidine kinase [Micropruina sp.]|uniref:sensor histidine kinase n=1 Tax=Micropruina sp. TaxID=2737536 RepID=UPI0039E288EA
MRTDDVAEGCDDLQQRAARVDDTSDAGEGGGDAWYWGVGRTHVRVEGGSAPVSFPLGTVVIFAIGLAFEPTLPIGWAAVFPMLFLACRLGAAVPWAALAAALPTIALVARAGLDSPFLPASLLQGLAAGGSAILFGLWIGQIAAQSSQRAQLIQRLEASQNEARALSRAAGVATERARLAAEIHDTLAQGFTSIVTLVQAAESKLDSDPTAARRHLCLAAETARENLAEARAMVHELTPSALASGNLAEAIRRRAEQFGRETSATVTVRADDIDGLPTAVEVVLLRAAQEALANAGKHAAATEVSVELIDTGDAVRLSVADDGVGFDPHAPHEGFGLDGMRKRSEAVGGSFRVDSGQDGTRVTVEVPW